MIYCAFLLCVAHYMYDEQYCEKLVWCSNWIFKFNCKISIKFQMLVHASIDELFMSYICLVISVQGFWGAETRPIWNFSNRWSRLRHSSALSLSDRLCPIKTPALLSLMSVWKRLVPIFFYSPHSHTLLFKSISNIGMVLLEI